MLRLSFHHRIPLAVLIVGLCSSFGAFNYTHNAARERYHERLTVMAEGLRDEIVSKINIINYGLGGANGVFAASQFVGYHEWRAYVGSRDMAAEFPGTMGFGYIEYVRRENLPEFLSKVRADAQPNFQIKSSGSYNDLFVIRFIEPAEGNQPAIGFDIGSEQMRREAAELAMRSGLPTITKKIKLVQTMQDEAGFLYLRPVYRNGGPHVTLEQRRNEIQGWVYAPFTLQKIIAPLLKRYGELMSLSVFEGETPQSGRLLFRSDDTEVEAEDRRTLSLNVGQQPWTVVLHPKSDFVLRYDSSSFSLMVGLLGVFAAFLVSGGIWIYLAERYRKLTSQIRAGEYFAQGILDSANVSIIVTEPHGTIRVFNQAASRMLGYRAEDVVGKVTPVMIHDPQEVAAEAQALSVKYGKTIEPGFDVFVVESRINIATEREWTYVRRDGTRFPVILLVTTMRNEQGEITGYMGIAADISERKKQEEDLRDRTIQLDFYKRAMDQSCIVAITEVDGNIIYANEKFCEISKYSVDELIGRDHRIINSGQHSKEFMRDLWRTIASGKIWRGDIKNRAKDGTYYWVDTIIVPALDETGKPNKYFSIRRDITEQKQNEAELERKSQELLDAREAAVSSSRAKGEFLANMSHEIRTPLTGIIGYSDSLLSDQLSPEERTTAIETVIRNGNHLLGVINDILDLSKIESGKLDVELVLSDLTEILNDIANLMAHKARDKGLSLGFEYVYPIPRRIRTDPLRLRQILINLVGNAVKFTSVGGVKVNVQYAESQGQLQFDVVDTGPGLSSEQKARLFTAFSQGDTSITRKFGGTGLGLVISSMLATKLGGGLSLESEVGKGSVFTVTIATGEVDRADLVSSLPRASEVAIRSLAEALPELCGSVLVAEDGEDNRGLLAFLLKKMGVNFTMVVNGALAVEEVSRRSFDLILMDGQMPVMDGYSAIKKIRELGFDIPIIALTANAMKADVEQAFLAGSTDFLGKPFTRSQLTVKLARYLPRTSPETTRNPVELSVHTIEILKETPEMLDLIVTLIGNIPKRSAAISNAVNEGDLAKASMLAHSVRGATANVGFINISNIFGNIEEAANSGDVERIRQELGHLTLFIEEVGQVEGQLRSVVLKTGYSHEQ